MRRAETPDRLESFANDPRIRPFIGAGYGPVKAGSTWASSIGLEWDTGGIVFMYQGDGVYDAHLLFLPGTWGVPGKCLKALQYLFTRTNARKVIGTIPEGHARARRIAVQAGMALKEIRDGSAHYALTAREWIKTRT